MKRKNEMRIAALVSIIILATLLVASASISAERRSAAGGNRPPHVPTLSGLTLGVLGASYDYSVSATDPNRDRVRYTFDWGDGSTSSTSFVNSGKCKSASHTWSTAGIYRVITMATDSKGASSSQSSPLTVTIGNPPTDEEKQQLILGWIQRHNNDGGNNWPVEVILAMIFQEAGDGAFHSSGDYYLYNNYKYGPWTEPDNTRLYRGYAFFSDGPMQVTPGSGFAKNSNGYAKSYTYGCSKFGGYKNDQIGYETGIFDGIACLDYNYAANWGRGYINAILHYNSGPYTIYLYKTKKQGDRRYLAHIAEKLATSVPSTYGLSNPAWVSALEQGQVELDQIMSGLPSGKSKAYYQKYENELNRRLRLINLAP